jgi:TolB protein
MKTFLAFLIVVLHGASLIVSDVMSKPDSDRILSVGTIAYSITPVNGDNEIYIINSDGSGRTPLTAHEGRDAGPAWSPDGSRIAFYVHAVDELSWFIFVMDSNGDNIEQLTDMEGVWDNSPTWSPNGTRIAFAREYPDQGYRSEIWVMNHDGSNQHQVDSILGGGPEWSPDGGRIVFHSDSDGNYEIYTMDIDGSNVERLTSTDDDEFWPDWSPDGSKIAFVSERDGNAEIYKMNADSTNQERLTTNNSEDWRPDWSPDGTEIAFVSLRDGNYEIYIMDAEGDNQRRLTHTTVHAIQPDWHPESGVGIDEESVEVVMPKRLELFPNYPNPFNPSTTIKYYLPEDTKVVLTIYNNRGREVRTLVNQTQASGIKTVVWDGRDNSGNPVSSGIYIYRIQTGDSAKSVCKKMLMLK